jgi:hypothetical protein
VEDFVVIFRILQIIRGKTKLKIRERSKEEEAAKG